MITNLELYNFKSFVAESIDLGQLTLLTGLNSSGKSSVIQSFLLLEKFSVGEAPLLDGHGDYAELTNPAGKYFEILATLNSESEVIHFDSRKSLERNVASAISFPTIIYISADRFGPQTTVPYHSLNTGLGQRGENIFKCIETWSDELIPDLARHPDSQGDTLKYNIQAWLGVISPSVDFQYTFDSKSDSSYGTFDGYRSKNVGFGLSYTLPVITALLMGTILKNTLVIIENPEAHLHPRGQTAMAQLIAACAEAGAQIVIETHSDHLFDGVRIYAKQQEGDFYEKVKIYWFEQKIEPNRRKNTRVEPAILDKNGRIKHWPKGLFDQFEINARKLL